MSTELPVTQARDRISEITNRAEYTGETTYLTKHGRRTSAIVSADAAQLLEDLEDLIDIQAVEAVRARLDAGTEGRRRLISRD